MSEPLVQARELTFAYAGQSTPAVADLDFAIAEGEIFGFLGPSGAGKSTTQKILTGLLKGYAGAATVYGRDLSDWRSDLYERIGVSFEFPNHYLKLTALENLHYFRGLFRNATRTPAELLESVGLEDAGDVPVGQYSKGMKTRLGVARALLHSPDLLFMDEPTAGLDPASARLIKDLIRAHREAGHSVFLTTHDMNAVDELCDRAAFIVDGRIATIGAPQRLKLQYGNRSLRIEYRDSRGVTKRSFALDGLADDAEFHRILRHEEVLTMHTQEATLDDVFIEVTGRRLQ